MCTPGLSMVGGLLLLAGLWGVALQGPLLRLPLPLWGDGSALWLPVLAAPAPGLATPLAS